MKQSSKKNEEKKYAELKQGCGMLWQFEGGEKTLLKDKIKQGYNYFLEKFGVEPNRAEINPYFGDVEIDGLSIKTDIKVGKINIIFYCDKNLKSSEEKA